MTTQASLHKVAILQSPYQYVSVFDTILNLHHLAHSNFNEPPFLKPIDSDPGLNFSNYRIACRIVSVYYHRDDEHKESYANVLLDVSFDMIDAVLGMCSIVL
jgi:hypothetical protein